MASNVSSSPSQSLINSTLLPLKRGSISISVEQPSTKLTRQLPGTIILQSTQDYLSSVSTVNGSKGSTSGPHLPVDTSEKNTTASNGNKRPGIVLKFTLQGKKNKEEYKTLIPTLYGKESAKEETLSNKEETYYKGMDGKGKDQDQTPDEKDTTQSQVPLGLGLGFVPKEKARKSNKNKSLFSTFSVSLTRDEIEADLVAMGLSKRTNRSKKRPRNVQNQLDDLFPGMSLKSITPDRYKVRDAT